jgi:OFA family oxalate/formate antiporter-like MFS transporter
MLTKTQNLPDSLHPDIMAAIAGRKRWPIALSGVLMEFAIGSVYAWSVFKLPIMNLHHWSAPQVGFTFTLAIVFLALSAALGGGLVDRLNTIKTGIFAAVLFGCGTMLAGMAVAIGSLTLLWLGYGVIAGTGAGLIYIIPIRVLLQWFPDRKGTITGLAVMGFGFGAAAVSQIAPVLIKHLGLSPTFYLLGMVFFVLLTAASFKMSRPDFCGVLSGSGTEQKDASADLASALQMNQFYIIWLSLFINVVGGIALISNLSPMVQSIFGLTGVQAGTVVLAGSLANAGGRVFWGALSERLGRRLTLQTIFLTQVPVFLLLPVIHNLPLFIIAICWILLCYGGGFGVMPSTAGDIFGSRNIARIYGCILLAWGAGGFAGPMLMDYVKVHFGNFRICLYVASAAVFAGFVIISFLKRRPAPSNSKS